jgi:nucleotide-binding universal stress UspA family protein
MSALDIKKILIPTDFSDTANIALDHAITLAKICNAEISLIHVVSALSYKVALPEVEEDESQNARIKKAITSKLESIANEILQNHGINVNTLVVSGKVRDEVVKKAEELDSDIIILGTHGVSGLKEFFMGSNAFRIVSEASCPVLSVQSKAKRAEYKKIVVPIDNSFHSREKLGISVKFALAYDATLLVIGLRSYDHDDENLNARFRMKMKQVNDYLDERDVKYQSEMLFCQSNIATATMDYAVKNDADLIVIMTEQEINTTGFFMGPYAQQVVNHSPIPVLSIRPTEGIISNVTPY